MLSGVTMLVHGYVPGFEGFPKWVPGMADQITERVAHANPEPPPPPTPPASSPNHTGATLAGRTLRLSSSSPFFTLFGLDLGAQLGRRIEIRLGPTYTGDERDTHFSLISEDGREVATGRWDYDAIPTFPSSGILDLTATSGLQLGDQLLPFALFFNTGDAGTFAGPVDGDFTLTDKVNGPPNPNPSPNPNPNPNPNPPGTTVEGLAAAALDQGKLQGVVIAGSKRAKGTVRLRFAFQGTGSAVGPANIEVFLSRDGTLDAGDVKVSLPAKALFVKAPKPPKPGRPPKPPKLPKPVKVKLVVPFGVSPGEYRLVARIAGPGIVAGESTVLGGTIFVA